MFLAPWLAVAVWTDLRQRRIPNAWVQVGIAVAVGLHAWLYALGQRPLAGASLWSPLWGVLVGAALFLPGYARGGMAAGDVKLMAAIGAFLGPVLVLWAALFAMVAGGLQGLCWWGWRRWGPVRARASGPTSGAVTAAFGMPYAPAMAAGVMALWARLTWHSSV
jgi:prepilin peptidase CpaA